MQTLLNNSDKDCLWYLFDNSYKILSGYCLIIVGVFGVLLNGWLFVTFVHSHLLISRSHVLILNFCAASLGRNLLGFPFAGPSGVAKRWLFGTSCCQLFAFLNQFFGTFQMTALFTVVMERYLLAKFYRREMDVHFRYYWTLIGLCWASSLIFATIPLFGYGVYSCDATGTVCSLLWPPLDSSAKQLGFAVPYVIICGVTPVVGMFYYMRKAVRLQKMYYRGPTEKMEKLLTKTIHVVCIMTLTMWIPSAVLAGWQWLPLMIYGYRPHVPPVLAIVAPIASEAAPIIPVLCYLLGDETLRSALLGRIQNHYALLHPVSSTRIKRDV